MKKNSLFLIIGLSVIVIVCTILFYVMGKTPEVQQEESDVEVFKEFLIADFDEEGMLVNSLVIDIEESSNDYILDLTEPSDDVYKSENNIKKKLADKYNLDFDVYVMEDSFKQNEMVTFTANIVNKGEEDFVFDGREFCEHILVVGDGVELRSTEIERDEIGEMENVVIRGGDRFTTYATKLMHYEKGEQVILFKTPFSIKEYIVEVE